MLRRRAEYDVVGLLTTFNEEADRVAMHAVRRELVERQAAAAGLPLWAIPLPWPCSNEQYELLMAQTCAKAIAEGIEGIAFGDLFLEDVRAYREKQTERDGAGTGVSGVGAAHACFGAGDDCFGYAGEVDLRRYSEA